MDLGSPHRRKNPLYIATSILLIVALALLTGSVAILLAAVLVLLVLFYPVFFALWDRIYGVEDIADQVFHAHTDDGWNIAMHFHRPAYPKPGAFPVIFSHGLAVNKYGIDLDRGHSLAYFLKQNGYPVFVLSLRGTGKSYHSSRGGYRDFCFDDIAEHDVTAVIRKVRELTGAPRVNWVGHSMGAMIAYGFLGRRLPGHEAIAALVSLGGPGKIDHARTTIWGAVSRHPWISQILDVKFGSQVIAPLSGRVASPIEDLVLNREIVSGVTVRKLMKNAIENVAPGLLSQFIDWMNSGHMYTKDGTFDYRRGYERIGIPALFIAGARDHIAPVDAVRFAYDHFGSRHKAFHVIGRESNVPFDYCHTGLVLSDRGILDVFPLVLEWLNRHGHEKRRRWLLGRLFNRIRTRRARKRAKGRRFWREEKAGREIISA